MYEYQLTGYVKNGDGLQLALYTSDEGVDGRTVVEIRDGKFSYRGTAGFIQKLFIRFEKGIESMSGYVFMAVYTEPGTITIGFEVVREDAGYRVRNYELIQGPVNKQAQSFFNEYRETVGPAAIVRPYSPETDALRSNVYPQARSKVLQLYERHFAEDTSGLHLYFLKLLTDQMKLPGFFESDQLSAEEKDQVRTLFSKIDPILAQTVDYRAVRATIRRMDRSGTEVDFTDYELESIDGHSKKLSALCSAQPYTVLNFWHSGCIRCRNFNRSLIPEYEHLKQAGMEMVSINVDDSRVKWKNATAEDGIPWPNLYAGRLTDILAQYRVRSFPTKIAYDRQLNFSGRDFKDKSELWRWIEERKL
ncbi:TlpA disulfide reductase family protein [Flavilitoribacter nigricans]|uniref:Thioredoxin domain-containing protein n=1 Tax=Flavilitoribacter nigricans (strain ATCC 23147 / DSM 23189 / NBRC 102662 / NCIMB 1420 / SS-2) TaxID=1122177 RepID=A0A2D0NE93_FLAN2|nr:TlpA disulfide reductase family protein [Flavilitoribacter nigricans]PHN06093.1 hypothetical protein CRP01_14075 [Flavilitoribacter nigricans DSM 23189 = NBRC 102662]